MKLASLQFLDIVEEIVSTQTLQAGMIALPRGTPVETAVMNVKLDPEAIPIYGVYIAPGGTNLFENIELPNTRAELQMVNKFVGKLVDIMTRRGDNCYNCVRKAALGQRKRRRRGVWKGRSGENRLRIRVPHR